MSEVEKKDEILLEKVRGLKSETTDVGRENTAVLLREAKRLSPSLDDVEAKRRMRAMSRRGFLIGGAAAVFGYLGYSWLKDPENAHLFDKAFKVNENFSQDYFSARHLAPEFPRSMAAEPRYNGDVGLTGEFDPPGWRLQVAGLASPQSFRQYTADLNNVATNESPLPGVLLTLDDLKMLPRVEMTTELKCIEGWSIIVNWGGVRFSDFAAAFKPLATDYVSLKTPDNAYYVGWDMPSIMHPQTLLAYEMNGAPLTPQHGAPLRIVTTVKYGIKQIKRIGRIEFTNTRPADFWAERGYDWYSGH
ncbi:MAG: molybdopterin-dependent oxidoreductase [Acidobacteriota bacterium]